MRKVHTVWLFSSVLLCLCAGVSAQNSLGVGTSTPDPSAVLEVSSTTRGLLIPRMTTSAVNGISKPAKGLLVYDSSRNLLLVNMGLPLSPDWENIIVGSGWTLTGNAGTHGASNFIGASDGGALQFRVNNQQAGLIDSLSLNTFLGYGAGAKNVSGTSNTAVGYKALASNTTGINNAALGDRALESNTTGSLNLAVGSGALDSNQTGNSLVAIGTDAQFFRRSGDDNIGIGEDAMDDNEDGINNIAIGSNAGRFSIHASNNTIVGDLAGFGHNMGNENVIMGSSSNVGADGGFNVVAIGSQVVPPGLDAIRIGNTATNSIGGFANWTNFSDGRFKKDMKEDVKGVDFIMRLRPVTYHLDISGIQRKLSEGQPATKDASRLQAARDEREKKLFSGFAAQEVEKAAQDAGYEFSGVEKPANEKEFYGLRYSTFVVPLVKALQEQQRVIEAMMKKAEALEKELATH